jgi:hypothetical protein
MRPQELLANRPDECGFWAVPSSGDTLTARMPDTSDNEAVIWEQAGLDWQAAQKSKQNWVIYVVVVNLQ